jgi:hypothetical protein
VPQMFQKTQKKRKHPHQSRLLFVQLRSECYSRYYYRHVRVLRGDLCRSLCRTDWCKDNPNGSNSQFETHWRKLDSFAKQVH